MSLVQRLGGSELDLAVSQAQRQHLSLLRAAARAFRACAHYVPWRGLHVLAVRQSEWAASAGSRWAVWSQGARASSAGSAGTTC